MIKNSSRLSDSSVRAFACVQHKLEIVIKGLHFDFCLRPWWGLYAIVSYIYGIISCHTISHTWISPIWNWNYDWNIDFPHHLIFAMLSFYIRPITIFLWEEMSENCHFFDRLQGLGNGWPLTQPYHTFLFNRQIIYYYNCVNWNVNVLSVSLTPTFVFTLYEIPIPHSIENYFGDGRRVIVFLQSLENCLKIESG